MGYIYIYWSIFISDGFDFVGGGKLPGPFGGEGSCSGSQYGDCFSTRFVWRTDGMMEIYG